MQAAQLVQQRLPAMEVVGSTYPVSPLYLTASKAVGGLQMAALGGIFFGERVFEAAGLAEPPAWYRQLAGNRFGVAMGVWFVGNAIGSKLVATGAFEVYYDGHLVFSKLSQGRLPYATELVQGIEAKMAPVPTGAAPAGAAAGAAAVPQGQASEDAQPAAGTAAAAAAA